MMFDNSFVTNYYSRQMVEAEAWAQPHRFPKRCEPRPPPVSVYSHIQTPIKQLVVGRLIPQEDMMISIQRELHGKYLELESNGLGLGAF